METVLVNNYELIFSFFTLTFLEIVLGIDNLVFIAIVVSNLPNRYKNKARFIGIALALIIRVIMLFTLSWIMSLTKPLFTLFTIEFSFKNLLLIAGGVFLITKSGIEIYRDVAHLPEENSEKKRSYPKKESFFSAILQIALIDFVFSFDSIITAVAMTNNIPIMIAAIVVAMVVMLFSSNYVSAILQKYHSLKIMALAFIFMIGIILLADGVDIHIEKGYLYFSLFFAITIEWLNIMANKKRN